LKGGGKYPNREGERGPSACDFGEKLETDKIRFNKKKKKKKKKNQRIRGTTKKDVPTVLGVHNRHSTLNTGETAQTGPKTGPKRGGRKKIKKKERGHY